MLYKLQYKIVDIIILMRLMRLKVGISVWTET